VVGSAFWTWSERENWFRFVNWFSPLAGNAGRWVQDYQRSIMNKDLEIIEELENELGIKLPQRRVGERLPINLKDKRDSVDIEDVYNQWCIGYFVDKRNSVVCLSLAPKKGGLNLKSIPSSIFKLKHLKILNLGENKITNLPDEIITLPKLKKLQLIRNQITELSPFILKLGIPILVEKDIAGRDDREIFIGENPIEKPPIEIVAQGNEAILNYFDQIDQAKGQTQYLFEAKLLIIGDGGTGKTSFKRRLMNVNSEMPQAEDTTFGIEVDKWHFPLQFSSHPELGTVRFNVNIWDFGGQKIYRGTHQIFFSDKSYYVLVADTREQGTDFSYWLNTVKQLAGDDSGILILLNKKHGHEMKFDERGFRGHFGKIIKDVFELDLQNDIGRIYDLQEVVKLHLKQLPNIGDPLPPLWVKIREDLLSEKGNFITFDRFRTICRMHNITNPRVIRTLSGYFNRIGVFTHYIDDPVLSERIYLNSNWLVNTVYEVLDNERVKEKKGRLIESDVQKIWQKQELDFEINKFTQLMHNFGLMYHVPNSKEYVVPEHLPTDQPYDKWEYEHFPDILHFIYEFDKYMPKGLMSRLIVSLNNYINDHNLVWHRGFNIELKGTHAEIVETYGAENSFRIRIVGANKIEFLSIIRERFTDVLKPFKNLNYKQLIPCPCKECAKLPVPGFHDYDKILNLREKGKTGSQCPEGEIVEISELLKITEFKKQEKENGDRERLGNHSGIKTLDLFLASSSELKIDREQVEIWVNRENKKLVKKGFFLNLNLWEDFLDAISETRLQDEYNKTVAKSDLVICLFATKVGKYTEEEFEIAHSNFKEKGKPKYIYTFFKEVQVSTSDLNLDDLISLKNFKSKLATLGHFYTNYKSIEDLKGQLKNQLDKIFEEIS
jgi:internalin A